jgi:hypothetical protein
MRSSFSRKNNPRNLAAPFRRFWSARRADCTRNPGRAQCVGEVRPRRPGANALTPVANRLAARAARQGASRLNQISAAAQLLAVSGRGTAGETFRTFALFGPPCVSIRVSTIGPGAKPEAVPLLCDIPARRIFADTVPAFLAVPVGVACCIAVPTFDMPALGAGVRVD